MGWLRSIQDFIVNLPGVLYGDRLHEGWFGIAGAIYVTCVGLAFLICGYRCIHEWAKAADIRFRKSRVDEINLKRPPNTAPKEIDWVKARKQQVRSWRFAIPYGLLVYGTLYWWFRMDYTWKMFFMLAAFWLVMAFPIRVLWIANVVWTQRKLAQKEPQGLNNQHVGATWTFKEVNKQMVRCPIGGMYLHDMTVRQAVAHYMSWGLQKSSKRTRGFDGLFQIFNPFIKLFGLRWLQPRLTLPLFICMAYAFAWSLTQVWAVFYLYKEFYERSPALKPKGWTSDNAMEPLIGDTGAIPDTPGDAAAAGSK